jgi:Prokaryotic N-terminal methylation motif
MKRQSDKATESQRKLKNNRQSGFTILEALIACVIFVSIFLPLTSFLFKDSYFVADRDKMTALCLLDQESRTLQVFPQLYAPVKKKQINGLEWQLKTEMQGKSLILFKISAFKREHLIENVVFRAYEK